MYKSPIYISLYAFYLVYSFLRLLYIMFSKEDLHGDNLNRLCCIIMDQMGHHPLEKYSMLSNASQQEFDNRLNEYIKYLPDVDWEDNYC